MTSARRLRPEDQTVAPALAQGSPAESSPAPIPLGPRPAAAGRRSPSWNGAEVMRLQRTAGNHAVQRLLQREFALEHVVREPREQSLTAAQLRSARRYNAVLFTDPAEIAVVRDVLGIAKEPPVVDGDFTRAVLGYQASSGLTRDGFPGPRPRRPSTSRPARRATASTPRAP